MSDLHDYYARLLDSLDIALCVFDENDRALVWNQTFLRFFPEHNGHVHVGEQYSANLRRFYANRLSADELSHIERYIAEGITRHREQARPFMFNHLGRRFRVSSLPGPAGLRVRIWHEEGAASAGVAPSPDANLSIDDLDYIPDGASVLDSAGRIIATNAEFLRLYGLPLDEPIVGLTLDGILARLWSAAPAGSAPPSLFLDKLRYTGLPFEVPLPGERWCRAIAHQTPDGTLYLTHSEITALKRQHKELLLAEARARESERRLREEHDRLAVMASTDSLTGLANRRQFDATLDQELKRSVREVSPISLMLVDIDYFKEVNDSFGHLIGDVCLQRVAATVRGVLRPGDLAARYGGEEFAAIFPATDARGARRIADELRQSMMAQEWSSIHPDLADIRLSIGIRSVQNTRQITAAHLINEADAMLYRAKSQGRDRVEQSCE